MYSYNPNTSKIFLTDGMVEIKPGTSEWNSYVNDWLSKGNAPTITDHKTQDDIDAENHMISRAERDAKLATGFIVDYTNPTTNDNYKIWFNEANLNSFVNNVGLADKLNETSIEWQDVSRTWITIPLTDGYAISEQGRTMLQAIYKGE